MKRATILINTLTLEVGVFSSLEKLLQKHEHYRAHVSDIQKHLAKKSDWAKGGFLIRRVVVNET